MSDEAGELPPVHMVRQYDTHRLIPSKYNPDLSSVLMRISDSEQHLRDVFDLDQATNERLLGENGLLTGIGSHELVFGVPNYRIVNAAFTHAHPLGARFNGPDRGAWYAAFSLRTGQAEVAFHKATEYAEIGRFEDSLTYDDYLADFSGEFHDVRNSPEFNSVLAPDSYVSSQTLSERLLAVGSAGIVYPSVRHTGGTCLACFRPSLIGNVRKDKRYRFSWQGDPVPKIACTSAI
ncbi:MAG TPA: RES family NAD+ phosphorylase [Bryobacteraceae bacterium]|nr:RES family NAD+ phosphorylase [Bryobacteraceae bacterium]HTF67548.1 RES family NAD+ phosphorylase [Edaphobacter sp.]